MLGVTVFALAAGSAWAADQSTEKNKSNISNATRSEDSTFAKLDKNKDGYISKAEAKVDAALTKDFDKFDLNHDGKLNRAEYLAARAKEDTGSVVNKVTGKDKAKDSSSAGSSSSSK
jgi:Ca2+-binding EF-hand superfamily protein